MVEYDPLVSSGMGFRVWRRTVACTTENPWLALSVGYLRFGDKRALIPILI